MPISFFAPRAPKEERDNKAKGVTQASRQGYALQNRNKREQREYVIYTNILSRSIVVLYRNT